MGILVPIIFFITGWIVSFWIKDARVGNPDFIGWTSFYTAIICLLLGLGTFGGKDENGNPIPKNRHHFFYIPILFWGLILGGLSAYLLLAAGKKADEAAKEEAAVADTIPRINFYNPTSDTLLYVISDESGLFEKEKLEPFTTYTREVDVRSYLLAGLTTEGESTLALPSAKDYDTSLYVNIKEGDSYIRQRIIHKLSGVAGSYEQNWMLLNGDYDMIVVDVTELYDGTINKEKAAKIDWMKKIRSRHSGKELIELKIMPSKAGGSVYVSNPNTYLPISNSKDRSVYMVLTFLHDEEVGNDFIKESVEYVIM